MDVDLSRRAAAITKTRTYDALDFDERRVFIKGLEDASSFATLASRWQKVITDGEQELGENAAKIAPDRLDRFTWKAGDFQMLTPQEVEQTLTPAEALAKHTEMMKQKYGEETS